MTSREGEKWTRRDIVKAGLAAGGMSFLPWVDASAKRGRGRNGDGHRDRDRRGPRITPFEAELPVPPVLNPCPPFNTDCTTHPDVLNVSGQFTRPTKFYEIHMQENVAEIIPGFDTPIWGYNGMFPGPTIRARIGEPVVVRFANELETCTSVHLHGAHNPADFDGYPCQFTFPQHLDRECLELLREGCPFPPHFLFKDYCYPNVVPVDDAHPGGDPNHAPSTLWYHDHAMDLTGHNVYMGLAGFYIVTDDLEDNLIDMGKLPSEEFDIAVVLQDRLFDENGELIYDPLDHDGFLGDTFVVNGKVQPHFRVQRRKYRFRFLNGANARFFELRLSSGSFLRIANDSWLLPFAVPQQNVFLGMAERADVIIDFRNAPDEVFLEHILVQEDGRGPEGDLEERETRVPGVPLIKFIVEGAPVGNDATIAPGDALRPHTPIREDEIQVTRRFEFERSNGAWVTNGEFFDPAHPGLDDNDRRVTPQLGTAERWIFENKGGGWWHPIHIHLESQEIQSINGRLPAIHNAFKKDTGSLGPNDEAEIFIKPRTFPGPFVFHCHNIEHEDMRMMVRWDAVT